MHDAGMHETGSQAAGMHVTGMHDGCCACALFSVTVASIAGAIYAVARRKWRRARSSSLVSPPSFIAARYRKSNSHATRRELPATEFRRTCDRFALPGRSAKMAAITSFQRLTGLVSRKFAAAENSVPQGQGWWHRNRHSLVRARRSASFNYGGGAAKVPIVLVYERQEGVG